MAFLRCGFRIGTLALVGVLAATRAAGADANPWASTASQALIGPMRLNVAFVDQTGKARAAIVSSLPPSALDGLSGLATAAKSPLFQWQNGKGGYIDALWSAMRPSVCSDIQKSVLRLVNHSPNNAYDTGCITNPRGYLTAAFETQWQNAQYRTVNGRRILFTYRVPFNGVTFWVSSPDTCHRGQSCAGATDPQFTVVFTEIIQVTCTAASAATGPSLGLPAPCTSASSTSVDGVYGGDLTGNLNAAATQFGKQLIALGGSVVVTAGASAPVAAALAIAGAIGVAVNAIGTAAASISDKHLRDAVSLWVAGLGSPTLATNANNVGAQFQNLFQNAYYSQLAGLKGFGVGVGTGYALNFTMGYAPAAKPVVRNVVASGNATNLFSPTIALAQSEVQPGDTIPVKASYFAGAYVNELDIGWNKTVLGNPKTAVSWGPPNTTVQTTSLTYKAKNLKPSTAYAFRVHECDGLTCAPWSAILVTKTEAGGSDQVLFWLDADKAHPIGAATLGASTGQTFTAPITIPNSTKPGQHVLNAAILGKPAATASITVCPPGLCGPTLNVVNMSNGTLYTTRAIVEVGNPVTFRCSRFTPGGTVFFFVDSATGKKAASAVVGPAQNCQATFNFPMTASGQHKVIAVEKQGAQTLQAGADVFVEAAAQ